MATSGAENATWFTEFSPDQRHCSSSLLNGCLKPDTGLDQDDLWTGQAFSMQVKKVLYHERSAHQDVLVFESVSYGNVLVLDGLIQCTERDEFAYQEMLAHLPLFCHPCPRRVLIIGGGDGGILREVLRHDCVEEAVLCEIDEVVVGVARKYLPEMSSFLDDPRATLKICDGAAYVAANPVSFDVIIVDSPDPLSNSCAEVLFTKPFYQTLREALRDERGVVGLQCESYWLFLKCIRKMMSYCRDLFPSVAYGCSSAPTYPSGMIGYFLCGNNAATALKQPCREPTALQLDMMKFYNADVHRAAFVLPEFVRKGLEGLDSA